MSFSMDLYSGGIDVQGLKHYLPVGASGLMYELLALNVSSCCNNMGFFNTMKYMFLD